MMSPNSNNPITLDFSDDQENEENQEYSLSDKNSPPIPETVYGNDADKTFFDKYKKLKKFVQTINIAEELKEEELNEIGQQIIESTEYDELSRQEWLDNLKDALKVTKLTKEIKNYPWPKAANVKYPLAMKGCIDYNSRMLPEIIQGDQVVKFDVMKEVITDDDEALARRRSSHMSFQRLKMSKHWRKELDKSLMVLSLVGVVFKKSYWDNFAQIPDSDLCMPDDIIINNNVQSLEKAERVTHRIYLSENEVIEKMNAGLFIEHDLDTIKNQTKDDPNKNKLNPDKQESLMDEKSFEDKMWVFYEQHSFLDLDEDGYYEPYIITVHIESKKVFRIVARYDLKRICFNKKSKKLIGIVPINYFTDYHFIPSPDGDFYSLGFAQLIYPMNKAINTIINQLLDAGHLSTLGAGLFGKSLRIKKGAFRIKPGMWEQVDSDGTDLAQNIIPLPTKEPSPTLFQLLGLLIQSAEELISLTDVMQGQGTPGNMAATTSNNLVEQGMKVYTAILTRFNESLTREYESFYELNKKYLSESQYFKTSVASGMISPNDYESDDFSIFPVADPDMSTESRRLSRAQILLSLPNSIPGIDPYEVGIQFLSALRFPNIDKLLPKPQPPDPNAPPPLPDQLTMAQIENIKMQTADLLMKRELEGLELDIKEKREEMEQNQIAAEIEGGKVSNMVQIAELEQTADQQAMQNAMQIADKIQEETINQLSEPFPGAEDLIQRIKNLEDAVGQEIGLPSDSQQQQPSQSLQPGTQGIPAGQTGQQAAFPPIDPALLQEFSKQLNEGKNQNESNIPKENETNKKETIKSGAKNESTSKAKSKKSSIKTKSTSLKPTTPSLPGHVPEALPLNEAE